MPEIQTIGINYIGINSIPLPNINFSIPQTPPVTLSIGSPIIDVPGCVKYNTYGGSSLDWLVYKNNSRISIYNMKNVQPETI